MLEAIIVEISRLNNQKWKEEADKTACIFDLIVRDFPVDETDRYWLVPIINAVQNVPFGFD